MREGPARPAQLDRGARAREEPTAHGVKLNNQIPPLEVQLIRYGQLDLSSSTSEVEPATQIVHSRRRTKKKGTFTRKQAEAMKSVRTEETHAQLRSRPV